MENTKMMNFKALKIVFLTIAYLFSNAVFAQIIDTTPDLKPWKYSSEIDSNSGKKIATISSISDYSGVGDLIITCTSGASSMEFISAKPISSKGRLLYRIGDAKPTNLTWKHSKKNGFTLFTSDKTMHIKLLKAIYSNSNVILLVDDPGGYSALLFLNSNGLKNSINLDRQTCGWQEKDFAPL